MKRMHPLFIFIAFFLFSCEKETIRTCENGQEGVLKEIHLDGCRWLIQLPDSSYLEPINLGDFDLKLRENQRVCFEYHEPTGIGSYCMVGKIVVIDFIE